MNKNVCAICRFIGEERRVTCKERVLRRAVIDPKKLGGMLERYMVAVIYLELT